MGWPCSARGRNKKVVQNFSLKRAHCQDLEVYRDRDAEFN